MSVAGGMPVLAIKSKEGEVNALMHTRGTDGPVQVMVELLNGTAPGGSISKKIVEAGVEAALADNPLWVDTTWLTADSAFGAAPLAALEHFDQEIEHTIADSPNSTNHA
ncbi:hypothetical protein [Saccharopolyspora terrae]|uniref:hypothetical protein n=1 Tax=Saccharopolyspora terrae TaxID=2530384 RepID=UPI001F19C232|nr:hypothetical protein [Saccharopolyspora terrae]